MSLSAPEPGLVIRYSYLWRDEARRGQEEGAKDRPCVVVLAVQTSDAGTTVLVAPITHTPPREAAAAIALPLAVKRRLGLDEARSWVITDDVNAFTWPGPDLRPVSGGESRFAYGRLPAALTNAVIAAVRQHAQRGGFAPTRR